MKKLAVIQVLSAVSGCVRLVIELRISRTNCRISQTGTDTTALPASGGNNGRLECGEDNGGGRNLRGICRS